MCSSNSDKPRLIILSDLWGKAKSDWLTFYTDILQSAFNLKFYDCRKLGKVDTSNSTEESLHQQFVDGGIDRAVQNLIVLEQHEVHILAFSIGGTIGWKYAQKSASVKSITCISSTRLRYESKKPDSHITLYYGEEDSYKPTKEWMQSMADDFNIIPGQGHEVYRELTFSGTLCRKLLKTSLRL